MTGCYEVRQISAAAQRLVTPPAVPRPAASAAALSAVRRGGERRAMTDEGNARRVRPCVRIDPGGDGRRVETVHGDASLRDADGLGDNVAQRKATSHPVRRTRPHFAIKPTRTAPAPSYGRAVVGRGA